MARKDPSRTSLDPATDHVDTWVVFEIACDNAPRSAAGVSQCRCHGLATRSAHGHARTIAPHALHGARAAALECLHRIHAHDCRAMRTNELGGVEAALEFIERLAEHVALSAGEYGGAVVV